MVISVRLIQRIYFTIREMAMREYFQPSHTSRTPPTHPCGINAPGPRTPGRVGVWWGWWWGWWGRNCRLAGPPSLPPTRAPITVGGTTSSHGSTHLHSGGSGGGGGGSQNGPPESLLIECQPRIIFLRLGVSFITAFISHSFSSFTISSEICTIFIRHISSRYYYVSTPLFHYASHDQRLAITFSSVFRAI